jgi:hypothetical protein
VAAETNGLPRSRWYLALALVAITPVLVAVALREGFAAEIADLLRFSLSMLLMNGTVLVVAWLPFHQPRSANAPRAPRTAVALAACAGGGALLVTATIAPGAWLAGLAMFACYGVDAATGRDRGLRWIPLVLGLALMVCWVFAGVGRWDAVLWWSLALALSAGLALNAASKAGDPGRVTRRSLSGALAGVGLLCSIGAIVLAARAPGAAVLIAVEGAFALVLMQRAARSFGQRGVFGAACAACTLASVVFVLAV